MSVNVSFNGSSYSVPTAGEKGWSNLTDYLVAIASGAVTMSDFKQNVREDASVSVTVLSDDSMVKLMNAADDLDITLPVGAEGKILTLIDKGIDAREITITDVGVVQSYKSILFLLSNGVTWELLYRVDYFDIDASEAYSMVQRDENGLVVSAQRVDAVKLPSGSTAERPITPAGSMLRFNTDTNKVEVYNGSVWAYLETSTGGVTELKDLSDVEPTLSPVLNDVLTFDGTKWDAAALPASAVDSVNGETGTVVLTQDDVGDGATYVRTENNFTDAKATKLDGMISVLTKGDIVVGNGTGEYVVGVGTNGQVLTADSTQPAGVRWGAGGTAATTLSDLTDTDIVTPADGEVLTYDSASGDWVNAPAGGGSLSSLSDTNIVDVATGDMLQYDGVSGKWLNVAYNPSITSLFTADGAIAAGEIVGISADDKVRAYASGGGTSSIGAYGTTTETITADESLYCDVIGLTDTMLLVVNIDPTNFNHISVTTYSWDGGTGTVDALVNLSLSTQEHQSCKLGYSHSDDDYVYVLMICQENTNFYNHLYLLTITKATGAISASSAHTIMSYINSNYGVGVVPLSLDTALCVHPNNSGSPHVTSVRIDWALGTCINLFNNYNSDWTFFIDACRIGLNDCLLCFNSPSGTCNAEIVTCSTFDGSLTFNGLSTLTGGSYNRSIACDVLSIGLNEGRAIVAIKTIRSADSYLELLTVGYKTTRQLGIIDSITPIQIGSVGAANDAVDVAVLNLIDKTAVVTTCDENLHNYAYPVNIDSEGMIDIGSPVNPTSATDNLPSKCCRLTDTEFVHIYDNTGANVNVGQFLEGVAFKGQFVAAGTAADGDPVVVTVLGENSHMTGLTAGSYYYNNGDGTLSNIGSERAFIGTAKNSTTIIVGR